MSPGRSMPNNKTEKFYPWEGKGFSFFSNRECEYFPCHPNVKAEDFNCLFCYCPLFADGNECGGNFKITPDGIKDCTACVLPHRRNSYGYITRRLQVMAKRLAVTQQY
jgi:Zn-finger protein